MVLLKTKAARCLAKFVKADGLTILCEWLREAARAVTALRRLLSSPRHLLSSSRLLSFLIAFGGHFAPVLLCSRPRLTSCVLPDHRPTAVGAPQIC